MIISIVFGYMSSFFANYNSQLNFMNQLLASFWNSDALFVGDDGAGGFHEDDWLFWRGSSVLVVSTDAYDLF